MDFLQFLIRVDFQVGIRFCFLKTFRYASKLAKNGADTSTI